MDLIFDLASILFRYLFVFYISYFLFQGVLFILSERGYRQTEPNVASKKQRYTILLFHVLAFSLMSFYPFFEDAEKINTALFGLYSFVFIVSAFILTNKLFSGSCPILFNGVIFLLDIGFINLYRLNQSLAEKQLMFCVIGFVILLIMPLAFKIMPKFEKLALLYLLLGLGLLIGVLVIGSSEYGAKNWLKIGGFTFQPSEFVKILFVLFLASYLRKDITKTKILIIGGLSAIFVLVLVLQKDLGGGLIFFMTFMVMFYVATGSEILFALGIVVALISSYGAYLKFSHIRERVLAWQDPWKSINDAGYQITQGLFAMASWGYFGSGLMRGRAKDIPVVERDFIFPAISEEFGMIFALLFIGVYIMVFYRGIHIALRCKKNFHSLVAVGFTSVLVFQTFVILGGVTKMIPMTGVTLPFVSYGGSSILASIIMIGFLQLIYAHTNGAAEK